jgi:hypothetical protein
MERSLSNDQRVSGQCNVKLHHTPWATAPSPSSHVLDRTGISRLPICACGIGAQCLTPFTPESPCHCPQIFFDPILAAHVKTLASVDLRYNIALESLTQDEDTVKAVLRGGEIGAKEEDTARYLVGCDGPAGVVRKALGIKLGGLGVFAHSINIFFRSPEMITLHDKGRARFHRSIDETSCWSEMIAIDGKELYRLSVFDDPSVA